MLNEQMAVEELARPAVDIDQIERWTAVGDQPLVRVTLDEVHPRVVADHAAGHPHGRPVDLDRGQPRGLVHAGQQPGRAHSGAGAQFEDAPTRLGRGQCAQQRAGAVLAGHGESDVDRALLRHEHSRRHVERFVDHAGPRSAPACSRRTAATWYAP